MAEPISTSAALAQEGLSLDRPPSRRPDPIPPRRGLQNLLQTSSNVRADYEPQRLQGIAQEIVDQWPFQQLGLERRPRLITDPSMITVRVMPELPVTQSRLGIMLRGGEAETKEFLRDLGKFAESTKHPYIEREFKMAARELSSLGPGSFKYYMDLGTAQGGGFNPATMRAAIRNVLLMEGFTVVPGAATMHPRQRERLLTEKAGKIAMGQAKGHPGFMFGMTGPDYSQAHTVATEFLGPSIGLRAPQGVEARLQRGEPTRQFKPEMTTGGGQASGKPVMAAIRDLRAQAAYEARKDVSAAARKMTPRQVYAKTVSFLESKMPSAMLEKLLTDSLTESELAIVSAGNADERLFENVTRRMMSNLTSDVEYKSFRDLSGPLSEHLAGQAGKTKRYVTRTTQAMIGTEHVTAEAAQRVYREEVRNLSKYLPGLRGRLGPSAPILAIAALLSAGMFAAGMRTED